MKLVVIKENVAIGIRSVERAIGEKLNLPVLKNILIEAENNKIKLTATDLEISVSYIVSGKIVENGKATAPAKILSSIIGNIPGERLNIDSKGGKITIKSDNYEADIQSLPADDFPPTPKIKNNALYIEIKPSVLREALEQVLVAAQFSDLRPELNSVLFSFSGDKLCLVSTDSFRLAEKTITKENFNTNYKNDFKFLLPLKSAAELARFVKEGEALNIYYDESQVLFKTDKSELLSRTIDYNFPDYEAIIPKRFEAEILVGSEELSGAIRLTSVFSSKNGEIRIKTKDGKKLIEISSSEQGLGENSYLLPARISGSFEETIFNWRHIADGIKAIKGEDISISINNENSPSKLKSPQDNSFFYILKPISAA